MRAKTKTKLKKIIPLTKTSLSQKNKMKKNLKMSKKCQACVIKERKKGANVLETSWENSLTAQNISFLCHSAANKYSPVKESHLCHYSSLFTLSSISRKSL